MLIFVDESGDTGLKFGRGSSEYFVVAAVRFDDIIEATRCDEAIAALRNELRVTPEFHFSNVPREKRLDFLRAVKNFNFEYNAVVFNKHKLFGPGFRFKNSFYKTAINYAFQNIIQRLRNAKVILDRSGDREFTRSMQAYLKRQTRRDDGTPRIRKVASEDSRRNNLLQLADMVCGAVARSFLNDKKDSNDYRSIIRCREHHVQFWPPYDK